MRLFGMTHPSPRNRASLCRCSQFRLSLRCSTALPRHCIPHCNSGVGFDRPHSKVLTCRARRCKTETAGASAAIDFAPSWRSRLEIAGSCETPRSTMSGLGQGQEPCPQTWNAEPGCSNQFLPRNVGFVKVRNLSMIEQSSRDLPYIRPSRCQLDPVGRLCHLFTNFLRRGKTLEISQRTDCRTNIRTLSEDMPSAIPIPL